MSEQGETPAAPAGPAAPERTTTLSLYVADLEWFRRWQLTVSNHEKKWLNMPDSIRFLTRRIDAMEDDEGA